MTEISPRVRAGLPRKETQSAGKTNPRVSMPAHSFGSLPYEVDLFEVLANVRIRSVALAPVDTDALGTSAK